MLVLNHTIMPKYHSQLLPVAFWNIAQEEGQLKNIGSKDEVIVFKGSHSFVADDGQSYTVTCIADENGFQSQGSHLHVAPKLKCCYHIGLGPKQSDQIYTNAGDIILGSILIHDCPH